MLVEMSLHPSPPAKGAVTSIFSLPPELLQEIFLFQEGFIAAQYYFNPSSHTCIPLDVPCQPYFWMTVAHVCRTWRRAALGCSFLWSRFAISIHPSWTMELLCRSGNAPLSIQYDLPEEQSQWDARVHSFAMVLGHLSRIENLFIMQRSPVPLPPAVVGMLSGCAPKLRSLLLHGHLFVSEPYAEPKPGAAYVPGLLCPENTPRLENFILSGSTSDLRLARPCASTLKHLHLSCSQNPAFDFQLPNPTALLEILSAAPLLETLRFGRYGTQAHIVGGEEPKKSAALPHLHTLSLTTHYGELAVLLAHLDLPALRSLTISTVYDMTYVTAFPSALKSKLTTLGAMHNLIIHVFPDTMRSRSPYLHISSYAADPGSVSTTEELTYERDFTFTLLECTNTMECAAAAAEICQRMTLYDVRSLKIEAYYVPGFVWAAVLGPMRSLSLLTVNGTYAAIRLPEALCPRRPGAHAEDQGSASVHDTTVTIDAPRLPVPALRKLQLSRVCLDRRVDYDAGNVGTWSGSFADILRARSEAGSLLEELMLVVCYNANEAALNTLRNAVGTMVIRERSDDTTLDTEYWDALI